MGTRQQTPTEALPGSSDPAMSFTTRFHDAAKWEQALMGDLTRIGWNVAPFGREQIPQKMRPELINWRDKDGHPTGIRWLPDMIATCPTTGEFCLIDAKSEGRSNTCNFAIEVAAVETGMALVTHLRTPVFYVWPGGLTLTPRSVFDNQHACLDGNGARGSGTPFYLIDKSFAVPGCWDRIHTTQPPQQMELL